MATKTAKKKVNTKVAKTPAVNSKSTKALEKSKSALLKTRHNKKALFVIGGIIVLFLAIFITKNFLLAVTVNGQPISRLAVIKELEKQGGKQTLQSMITKSLVLQEAKNKNIVITQDEIDKEIKKIEESLKGQNTTLDSALSLQGMTKNDLIKDIKLQLTVQKLVENTVSVTDEEAKKYVEDNKSYFPEGTSEEDMLKQAKEDLRQQKIATATQKLIDNLQKNSKIIYFVSY